MPAAKATPVKKASRQSQTAARATLAKKSTSVTAERRSSAPTKTTAKTTARVAVDKKGATTARRDVPAAKATAVKAESAVKAVPAAVTPAHDPDVTTMLVVARTESRDLRDWILNGSVGERPATPNYDEVCRRAELRQKNGGKLPRTNGQSTRKRATSNVRYSHDGKPCSDSQNRLSSCAWFFTRGISEATPDRIGVAELVEVLATLGVTDPREPGWSVELPNGVRLSADPK